MSRGLGSGLEPQDLLYNLQISRMLKLAFLTTLEMQFKNKKHLDVLTASKPKVLTVLENLILDGRIQPAKIEESVQKAEQEINNIIKKKN